MFQFPDRVRVQFDALEHQGEQITKGDVYSEEDSEFINIKDQIVKQLFAEYNVTALCIILKTLGCPDLKSCSALISISSIDYVINNDFARKRYVRKRFGIENKKVKHSFNETISNNSTSKQEVSTEHHCLNMNRTFDMNITKTGYIRGSASIHFTANAPHRFTFYKNSSETANLTEASTIFAQSQKVTLEPNTQMNVTHSLYQYEEYANYFIDLDILNISVIRHPAVDVTSTVYIATTPLFNFLQTHISFIEKLTYKNPIGIKIAISIDGRFVLENFPAIEKITNFGFDVVYGTPENITKMRIF